MLEIKNLSKSYFLNDKTITILENFNLTIPRNEFAVFLGPSGCGKTTLLKLIAGLIFPNAGHIFLDGKETMGPSSKKGVIFQQFSLFPWLTVEENILMGPRLKNMNLSHQQSLLDHYLEITQLTDYRHFYPKNLSGGMQQRVAISRALINHPQLILMDEPLNALDRQTREQMQNFILHIHNEEKKTTFFITHDITEAILLADKVYVVSSKPMIIKKCFDITFKKPRDYHLKYTQAFFELEKEIAHTLEEK